jgi:hypothetical protein
MSTNAKNDTFESQLFGLTTIIKCKVIFNGKEYISQGSGFYFMQYEFHDKDKQGGQWIKIEKHWLVTNRHVVLPVIEDAERIPDEFVFCFREVMGNIINWVTITLTKNVLLQRLKLHSDKGVDIALIDVNENIINLLENKSHNLIIPTSLGNKNLPKNNPLTIDVTSDVVVASYPKGFYDTVNKFPIVKSGIVASAWNMPFNGQPIFQIDAQLFPGSSGGLVISKPTNFAMIDGVPKQSAVKQFVFLGIYSGEYMFKEEIDFNNTKQIISKSYGLGNVWYSYLVTDIIQSGIQYS